LKIKKSSSIKLDLLKSYKSSILLILSSLDLIKKNLSDKYQKNNEKHDINGIDHSFCSKLSSISFENDMISARENNTDNKDNVDNFRSDSQNLMNLLKLIN
jgi:hypothetical protein